MDIYSFEVYTDEMFLYLVINVCTMNIMKKSEFIYKFTSVLTSPSWTKYMYHNNLKINEKPLIHCTYITEISMNVTLFIVM